MTRRRITPAIIMATTVATMAIVGADIAGAAGPAAPAAAAAISPHRAIYTMTLGSSSSDSGVVGAQGTMAYQWGETCDGWTIRQLYRLKMHYADTPDVIIDSSFITWESRDGQRYRFDQKETRNGTVDQEISGQAHLDGPGQGGFAEFVKPKQQTLKLAPGVLFPSAHTLLLIGEAQAGENFVSRRIFDGATAENAVQVSAVIGPKLPPDPAVAKLGPLVRRPGWRVRLAFFPANENIEKPDYELGMRLLDNGVSQDMTIDYGHYKIHATLDDIEPLPKPKC